MQPVELGLDEANRAVDLHCLVFLDNVPTRAH